MGVMVNKNKLNMSDRCFHVVDGTMDFMAVKRMSVGAFVKMLHG